MQGDHHSFPGDSELIFVVIAALEEDPRLGATFRSRWVLPGRESLADALERGISRGDLPPSLDVQFAVDVLVGTVFQRVLIIPEPLTEGLAEHLVDLITEGTLP